jgi:hypothetical protein
LPVGSWFATRPLVSGVAQAGENSSGVISIVGNFAFMRGFVNREKINRSGLKKKR